MNHLSPIEEGVEENEQAERLINNSSTTPSVVHPLRGLRPSQMFCLFLACVFATLMMFLLLSMYTSHTSSRTTNGFITTNISRDAMPNRS